MFNACFSLKTSNAVTIMSIQTVAPEMAPESYDLNYNYATFNSNHHQLFNGIKSEYSAPPTTSSVPTDYSHNHQQVHTSPEMYYNPLYVESNGTSLSNSNGSEGDASSMMMSQYYTSASPSVYGPYGEYGLERSPSSSSSGGNKPSTGRTSHSSANRSLARMQNKKINESTLNW